MEIKYKIIETHPQLHSVVVRFYTKLLTEELLCTYKDSEGTPILDEKKNIIRCKYDLNITFYEVPIPAGEDLKQYILARAPIDSMTLEEKILSISIDTSLDSLSSLVGVEEVGTVVLTPLPSEVIVAPPTPPTVPTAPTEVAFTVLTVAL